jgi:hypothetical protein
MFRRDRGFMIVVSALLAISLPGAAGAWSQSYAFNVILRPGWSAGSQWNSSLTENYMRWDRRYGGYPSVGLRYCRTDGSCYSYMWTQSPGPMYDTRTISYGRGECHAYGGNNYDVYVYECRVSNG